jgi:hypothetical protein
MFTIFFFTVLRLMLYFFFTTIKKLLFDLYIIFLNVYKHFEITWTLFSLPRNKQKINFDKCYTRDFSYT